MINIFAAVACFLAGTFNVFVFGATKDGTNAVLAVTNYMLFGLNLYLGLR